MTKKHCKQFYFLVHENYLIAILKKPSYLSNSNANPNQLISYKRAMSEKYRFWDLKHIKDCSAGKLIFTEYACGLVSFVASINVAQTQSP